MCFLYVMSIVGFALSIHFCGGQIADVAISKERLSCQFCTNESPVDDGCCKDSHIQVKVDDTHKAESGSKVPQVFNTDIWAPFKVLRFSGKEVSPALFKWLYERPPHIYKGVAIHLFNCVFRN